MEGGLSLGFCWECGGCELRRKGVWGGGAKGEERLTVGWE
jgi:hypothetical protein